MFPIPGMLMTSSDGWISDLCSFFSLAKNVSGSLIWKPIFRLKMQYNHSHKIPIECNGDT